VLVVILRVCTTEVLVKEVEDEGMDKNGKDTGLATHEETAGAGGEGKEEARAEDNEEENCKEHFGEFLLRIGKIKYAGRSKLT
jgi:hypothetical protein